MISINIAFFIQAANFLLLMLVLNIFLYKPIRKMLADRSVEISGSLEKVAEVDKDVREKMELYENKLREAKAKASSERETMKREAVEEETAVLEVARKEATDSINLIKDQVARESADARVFLKEQTISLSMDICEKVLGRRL